MAREARGADHAPTNGAPPACPRVLLVYTSTDWPGSIRIAEGLARAGMTCLAYCPSDHLITYSRHVTEWFAYPPPIDVATFQRSLAALTARWSPDLVLAADDAALWLLHRTRLDRGVSEAAPELAALLARSLGHPERLDDLERKSRLPDVARTLEIVVPDSCVNPTDAEAEAFAQEHGWPVVVKLDYTWGGNGVRFARTLDDLRALLAWQPDMPSIGHRARVLSRFVGGAAYVLTFSAWQGRLLGCLPLEKVRVAPGGSSAVVRYGSEALNGIAAGLVAHFGLTGVGDIDVRIDPRTGTPCVLEINPRVVPTVHLGGRFGHDLLTRLRLAIEGRDETREPCDDAVAARRQVALFPSEWQRDPRSPHLWTDVHDVPWDDPRLLVEMTRRFAPVPGAPVDPDRDLFETSSGELDHGAKHP